jgi:hypothetical protein
MKQDNVDRLFQSRTDFFKYVDIRNKNFRTLTPSIYLYKKYLKDRMTLTTGWKKGLIARIPVGFLGRSDISPLLGRLGFLETFRVVFEKHKAG